MTRKIVHCVFLLIPLVTGSPALAEIAGGLMNMFTAIMVLRSEQHEISNSLA